MKANGLLKWLVPAVLLGIVLIIGKSWVAAPDAEPAHDPENMLSRVEGIIPALEASHAVAHAIKLAATLNQEQAILVNLSGRGDKDMETVMAQSTGGQP